jgi:hypothetical protein
MKSIKKRRWRKMNNGGTGAVYGLGLIGALVYYLQHATTFGDGAFGILKAIVWPALLIYRLLGFFKM